MAGSIKEVAKRAGVSIATVSRVLNGTCAVTKEKEASVREALSYFDYEPNQAGRALVKGTNDLVGVYSSYSDVELFQSHYLMECLRGINSVIQTTQNSMVLLDERDPGYAQEGWEPRFTSFVKQRRIDSLIVLSLRQNDRTEERLESIASQGFLVGYIGKRFTEKCCNVYGCLEEYMGEGIDKLYEKGHRKIALYVVRERNRYMPDITGDAMKRHEDLEIVVLDTSEAGVGLTEQTVSLLGSGVTAFFAEDLDFIAQLQICLFQMGMLDKVSFQSIEHAKGQGENMLRPVNCYFVPAYVMGKTVASLLFSGSKAEERFYPEYFDRGSVGKI